MSRDESRIAPARRLAHGVLLRVARDGAYADRALDVALSRARLSSRDRALATELVYGTLRHQIFIDFVLGRLSNRPLRKTAVPVLAALRLGTYQLLETRVPRHAAVDETVALARSKTPHAAGFANALMRKVATLLDEGRLPDPTELYDDPLEALAVAGSHPLWILRELHARYGKKRVAAWVEANNQRPPISLRVNRLRARRDEIATMLTRDAGLTVETPSEFPDGLCVSPGGNVADWPGFNEGNYTVQDLAAQLVSCLAAPEPGAIVLDACAAPGGKAIHLAELMQDRGLVLAVDVHNAKTRLIDAAAKRLGLSSVKALAADASNPVALADLLADAGHPAVSVAVVDAPCSGLGTLRRNPELRLHDQKSVARLCQLQDALLDSVATVVEPGGVLVYAVCTVTDAEGPQRLVRFLETHTDFEVEAPEEPLFAPFIETVDARGKAQPVVRTWTDRHGSDSFFVVKLRRSD
ncbi:MAG: 16S rRNA (cytosine(967)-C(5))-methyltransferase RsmB [Myxococcota bacterium]